jgi:menaquinone-9 beta-reductase
VTGVREAEIGIVGGGPAGAAMAIRLAQAGKHVVLFERWPEPRWRACGVYSSPLTRRRLADLGLAPAALEQLIQPIAGLVVETLDGAAVRLAYDAVGDACGLDRPALDAALIDRARAAGAEIQQGAVARSIDWSDGKHGSAELDVADADGTSRWRVRLVVGADGRESVVARSAGVAGGRRFRRAGITVHRRSDLPMRQLPIDGRMVIGHGWYCGVAPVPGGRVNVGIVLAERELRRQLSGAGGVAGIVSRTVDQLPGRRQAWQDAPATDEVQVALPLAHRVRRATGERFVLVGDAAGFIDPLSGEGLHRALVSVELAADAIASWSKGDGDALRVYDRRLRTRFRNKDIVSWVLQAFIARPELLSYAVRRLASRHSLRRTFGLAMADMAPASKVLQPAFLGRLLAP